MPEEAATEDAVTQSYDLGIMIVNIIICFNSISNQLKQGHVRTWVKLFSQRLVAAASPGFSESRSRAWYMEKYVFILELLVSKNLDKLDR